MCVHDGELSDVIADNALINWRQLRRLAEQDKVKNKYVEAWSANLSKIIASSIFKFLVLIKALGSREIFWFK